MLKVQYAGEKITKRDKIHKFVDIEKFVDDQQSDRESEKIRIANTGIKKRLHGTI